jgi:protein-S-isoprenylcysteine O-methyltransferase Ste14
MLDSPKDLLHITSIGWFILFAYWMYSGMRTKITVKRQKYSSRVVYLLLMIGAFGLVYAGSFKIGFLGVRFLPEINWISYLGLAINLAGIIFAIVARTWLGSNWSGTVTVKKDHELIQSGPYAVTRHPIYTGLLFGLLGSAIILGEIRGLIAIVLFYISVQIKITLEEKFMETEFPEYNNYRRRTRKLIPFIY